MQKLILLSIILCTFLFQSTAALARLRGISYGNYCGAGNNGGKAKDDLDSACKYHDRCLAGRRLYSSPLSLLRRSASARKKSCPCDKGFVSRLRSVKSGGFARSAVRSYARKRMGIACKSKKKSRKKKTRRGRGRR